MNASELEEAKQSLVRIQQFDASSLAQRDKLGGELNFEEAILPVTRLISLFQKIPVDMLVDFSAGMIGKIKQQSDTFYSELTEVLEFSLAQANPSAARTALIDKIKTRYEGTFNALHPIISFALARTVDFGNLEEKGRAAVQAIQDRAEGLEKTLKQKSDNAEEALAHIRRTAAELGVSQEAHWFKSEADKHERLANGWKRATIGAAVLLMLYTMIFFFWRPLGSSIADAAQFISTKLLIFFTLAFLLFTSARIYGAHNHNTVINRHRQNALQTFQALVDATKSIESQDIVLNHAASCIFSPQETAFTRSGTGHSQGVNISMMEMFMRRGLGGDSA